MTEIDDISCRYLILILNNHDINRAFSELTTLFPANHVAYNRCGANFSIQLTQMIQIITRITAPIEIARAGRNFLNKLLISDNVPTNF